MTRTQTTSLRRCIHNLAVQVCSDACQCHQAGTLRTISQGYTVRPDLSLRYSVEPTLMNGAAFEHQDEEVCESKSLFEFYGEKVDRSAAYMQVMREMPVNSAGDILIRNFAQHVASEALLCPNYKSKIRAHINTLVRDAQGLQPHSARIWMTGIKPREEVVQISKRLLFRKPKLADLQERVSDDRVHWAHAWQRETWFSCIAELKSKAGRPWELQAEVDRLVRALRLFRLGAVSASRVDISAKSFSAMSNGRLGGPSMPGSRLEYEVSQADAPELNRFLHAIMPALPTPYNASSQEPDFLATAFDWYTDALLAPKPTQGAIASVAASLEALFLHDKQNEEIGYRLRQRVAALLGRYVGSPLQIRKSLSKAYSVRSDYVHGSISRENKRLTHEELTNLLVETANYARLGCLIFVQMAMIQKKTRQEILDLLSDSLIDDSSRHRFSKMCKTVVFAA